MNEAHCQSVFLLAEPFAAEGEYDFRKAQIPAQGPGLQGEWEGSHLGVAF